MDLLVCTCTLSLPSIFFPVLWRRLWQAVQIFYPMETSETFVFSFCYLFRYSKDPSLSLDFWFSQTSSCKSFLSRSRCTNLSRLGHFQQWCASLLCDPSTAS